MKTSPNKNIPQSSDWLQIQEDNGVIRNINLNQIAEISFYPSKVGESTVSIHYTSGRTVEFKGKVAEALWKLVNQGVSYPCSSSDKQV
jgi:hypothetical protein